MEYAGIDGYLLAPGCDLSYAPPPENLEAVAREVRDPSQEEEVKAKTVVTGVESKSVDLEVDSRADQVVIDVFTVDFEACAPF